MQAAGITFGLAVIRTGTGISSTATDPQKRPTQLSYFHQDHLGSIAAITDGVGKVIERLAYDPWGKRRYANGLSDKADTLVGVNTDRGYTLHEHLDEVGVVHMNGRVYDPLIGRFMSADPFIQSPDNLQSYNRYAYVLNNPLAYTDPSGYSWASKVWKSTVGAIIKETAREVAQIVNLLPSSIRGVAIAGVSVLTCGPGAPGCAALLTGGVTASAAYGNGASTSQALRAGVITGGTAYAFSAAGDVYAENPAAGYAAHAGVGCVSTVASGGACGQGAAAAVFGKYATVSIGDTFGVKPGQFNGYQMAATMVAGGVGSVIAGGKFENGATTAAFGYLFNELAHQTTKAQRGYEATFYPDDHMVCDITCWTDKPLDGSYPIEELVAGGGAAKLAKGLYAAGREITLGSNLRLAPFGNRTGNALGELPHYHRRGIDAVNNATKPGQGIGRHRPWETKSTDKSVWDRF